MAIIPSQRHRFAIPPDVHYLNCAYMAPLAYEVVAAMDAGARLKAAPWNFRAADFFTYPEALRLRAARLVGCGADDIAIVPSASYGLAVAAANVPLARGQTIVVLADQFPSNVYAWREKARTAGGRMVTVRRADDAGWTEAVVDAIDADTGIVAVPNVHWADGRLVDLARVGAACRHVGAALVLDLTQSLGAMPFDLAAAQPDFAVAAGYKWLMGPYGTGVLYAAPRHHGGTPIEQSWLSRAGAEDFARLVDYRDDFQPGARRFDMGEKSNPPLLMGLSAGIDMLAEWGVAAVAETIAAKTRIIADAADRLGLDVPDAAVRSPHILGLGFKGGVPPRLLERLADANVFASVRGSSLRIAPHLYNDETDIERLITVFSDVL